MDFTERFERAEKKLQKKPECQAWYGADDVCGLPESSDIHNPLNPKGHPFVAKNSLDKSLQE